jgi:hypothetical protein
MRVLSDSNPVLRQVILLNYFVVSSVPWGSIQEVQESNHGHIRKSAEVFHGFLNSSGQLFLLGVYFEVTSYEKDSWEMFCSSWIFK